MAENAAAPAAPPKKKGGLFKKPAWLEAQIKPVAKAVEKKDATEIFSRYTSSISDVLAEQKRKEALKEEKKLRAQKKRTEPGNPQKRRKLSEEGEYSDAALEEKKDSISPRRQSFRKSTTSSPQSLAKRYDAVATETQKKKATVIQLSDDSDTDSDSGVAPSPSKAKAQMAKSHIRQKEAAQVDEEEVHEEEDFPELARQARERAKQQELEKARSLLSTQCLDPTASASPTIDEPNPVIDILIYSQLENATYLLVKRKWNQRFKDIRQAWLERQVKIPPEIKKDIYFTWRGRKIYDVASCRSLGIKLDEYGQAIIPNDQGFADSGDKLILVATTDAQVKADKAAEDAEQERKELGDEPLEEEPVKQAEPVQLKVILRAKGYNDQKLIVKLDTTIERLVGAFRRANGLKNTQEVSLEVDGEELDPTHTIADVEIEDMDLIEVRVK